MRLKTTYLISILFAIILLLPTQTKAEGMSDEEIKAKLPQLLGQSNVGREFWVTIPPCYEDESGGADNFIKIFVTSPVKTLVTCEVPGSGYYRAQNTVPNDVIGFDIAPAWGQPFLFSGRRDNPRPEQIYRKRGIHIYAKDPIVVYVVVRYRYTSDGFLAIPVSGLGKEYIVASMADMVSMYPWAKTFPSITGIVGAYDNTKVRFTTGGNIFTETAGGLWTGESKTWRLDEGDVLMFMSNGFEQDLTGSKIVATKPVAVVSGNHCTNIPSMNRWCDYTVEMDLPMMTWGRHIPVGKVPNRSYSGIVRIFSKERNNKIYRDGRHILNIPKVGGIVGEGWQEMRIYPGQGSRSAMFSAEKPFSVTFYNPGVEEDNPRPNSDPFVMAMTPVEQFQKQITFCTPAIAGGLNFPENYLNLVYQIDENGFVPEDMMFAEVRQGQFNWTPIRSKFPGLDDPFAGKVDGKEYALKTILLPRDGVYMIKADRPFACYSFGYSSYDSYGYPTSAALADLSKPDTVAPDPLWEQECDGTIKGAVVTDRPDDTQIRSNLADIIYQKALSFNYDFEFEDIIPGETISTTWKLTVKDKTDDARAVITFMDRAGNDSTIIINYFANKVAIFESYDYGNLETDKVYTHEFRIVNLSEKSSVTIPAPIDDFLKLKDGNKNFTIKHSLPSPLTLQPLEEMFFTIDFSSATSGSFLDSVGIGDDCVYAYRFEIKANVGMPLIDVADFTFDKLKVGETAPPTEIQIRNDGSSELIITGYEMIPPMTVYSHDIDDFMSPDITIPAGESMQFQVSFTPDAVSEFPTAIYFTSNATGTDSICVLNGAGISPGLSASNILWPPVRIHRTTPDFPREPYPGPTSVEIRNDSTMATTITNYRILSGDEDLYAFNFDMKDFERTVEPYGGNFQVQFTFQPTRIGPHFVEIQLLDNQGINPTFTLEGSGKLGRITITPSLVDFGSMVVGNVSDEKTQTMTITNVDYGPYSDRVTIWDIKSSPGISTDMNAYGTEGFKYDKANTVSLTQPIVLTPGQSATIDIDAYFVAQKLGLAEGTITIPVEPAVCDAESLVENSWVGFGTDETWTVGSDETLICRGQSQILRIPITNTSDSNGIYVESVELSPANPEITFDGSGFTLEIDGSRTIEFVFLPTTVYSSVHEVIVNVRRADSSIDNSERGTLTVESQFFQRSTTASVAPRSVVPLANTPVEYAVSLNPGDEMVDAGITEIEFTVSYKKDFLAFNDLMNPNALQVGAAYRDNFVISSFNKAPVTADNIEEITFSLVSNDNITPINNPGEMFTMEFRGYFPSYTKGDDLTIEKDKVANIECVAVFAGNGTMCANVFSPEIQTVALEDVCADSLRQLFFSKDEYNLGEVNPNPIGSSGADIEFGVGLNGFTEIKIFNANSEVVAVPVSANLKSGNYSFQIPVDKLGSGVYFYEMKSGPFMKTRKLVIAK